jgi:hypothetical protein
VPVDDAGASPVQADNASAIAAAPASGMITRFERVILMGFLLIE